MESRSRPSVWKTVARGWRRRCPNCGEGNLFRRGLEVLDCCAACGLRYQKDHGGTWLFLIITDRIPILFGIALVYFGYRSDNTFAAVLFCLSMAIPMLATLRQRQGVALALDYLSRVYLPDSNDELPTSGR